MHLCKRERGIFAGKQIDKWQHIVRLKSKNKTFFRIKDYFLLLYYYCQFLKRPAIHNTCLSYQLLYSVKSIITIISCSQRFREDYINLIIYLNHYYNLVIQRNDSNWAQQVTIRANYFDYSHYSSSFAIIVISVTYVTTCIHILLLHICATSEFMMHVWD